MRTSSRLQGTIPFSVGMIVFVLPMPASAAKYTLKSYFAAKLARCLSMTFMRTDARTAACVTSSTGQFSMASPLHTWRDSSSSNVAHLSRGSTPTRASSYKFTNLHTLIHAGTPWQPGPCCAGFCKRRSPRQALRAAASRCRCSSRNRNSLVCSALY